jgi:hypothetical protein
MNSVLSKAQITKSLKQRTRSHDCNSSENIYIIATKRGQVIATYYDLRNAVKFAARIAAGCNVQIKKTDYPNRIARQSATATRKALAFGDSLKMLKPDDFTL